MTPVRAGAEPGRRPGGVAQLYVRLATCCPMAAAVRLSWLVTDSRKHSPRQPRVA